MFALVDLIRGQPDYGRQAQEQEANRQRAIREGTANIDRAFAGFTPQFYQQRAADYVDFALPQVGKQYREARDLIGYNLANRGLFGGSASQKQWGDLADKYATAKQNVADIGRQQAQSLQSQVEAARNQQLDFLYQSADPAGAGFGAVQAAASLSYPATMPIVAQQFTDLLNQYYYSQLVNSYKPTSYVFSPPGSGGSGAPIGQPSSVA